ncbi:MFS transporter [Actinopolymorpha singaporensis]|uniref:Predicted arabinose efflux permease, MFS family n=1 Tax=Actinopolymorpha singaporensis TaxID=117157 RepID=A0A1H1NFF7_9ACTN|nr:MFS transporter [Actinopolymorpha singaporensis]SDR97721.1 Predicted arabinose efflux permease, MFS family [Actinopolymorpha singaporensis]
MPFLSTYRPLLTDSRLRRLLGAFGVSDLGDGMSVVAVPLLAIEIAAPGQAGMLVGASVAAYALPGVVGALVFGRWLRRLPAASLLLTDSVLRAACLSAVALAWAFGVLRPAGLVALLGLSSLLHAWGSAGKFTLLAELLPPDQRLAGNSLASSTSSLAMIAGPAVAGVGAAVAGPGWVIGADGLSFALLGLVVWSVHREVRPDLHRARPADPTGARGSTSGLRFLRGRPTLLGLLVLTWAFNLLFGPVEVALPLHVTGGDRGHTELLGAYWTAFGLGAVAGGLTVGALRRLSPAPVLLAVVGCWSLILLPFGFGPPTAVELVCFGLGGMIYGPFPAVSYTLLQSRTPPAALSSVLAARSAVLLTAAPVGTAIGGPLTSVLAPAHVLAGSGAATLLLALTAVLAWRGRRILDRLSGPGRRSPRGPVTAPRPPAGEDRRRTATATHTPPPASPERSR